MNFLIFDLGNVLIDFDAAKMNRAIANDSRASVQEAGLAMESEHLIGIETSRLSIAAFVSFFQSEFGLTWDEEDWIAHYGMAFSLNQIGNRWRRLCMEQQMPVCLLSNLSLLSKMAIERMFPEVMQGNHENFYSYELKAHKPDPVIYEKTCAQLKTTAESCVFLDDRIANVKGAEGVGMQAYHFVPENFQNIQNALIKLGLRISS